MRGFLSRGDPGGGLGEPTEAGCSEGGDPSSFFPPVVESSSPLSFPDDADADAALEEENPEEDPGRRPWKTLTLRGTCEEEEDPDREDRHT